MPATTLFKNSTNFGATISTVSKIIGVYTTVLEKRVSTCISAEFNEGAAVQCCLLYDASGHFFRFPVFLCSLILNDHLIVMRRNDKKNSSSK